MPACHVGDRGASPLRGPNERMDGREAYGSGSLNRRGRPVLRWFESSSIPHHPGPAVEGYRVERLAKARRSRVRVTPCSSVKRSFGDNTSGLDAPAPFIPRWRNGKRSGPRPRGRKGRGSSTLPLGTNFSRRAFGPESLGYRSKTHGEEAAQAVPGSTPGLRRPAPRAKHARTFRFRSPSRMLRVIAFKAGCSGFDSRRIWRSVAHR